MTEKELKRINKLVDIPLKDLTKQQNEEIILLLKKKKAELGLDSHEEGMLVIAEENAFTLFQCEYKYRRYTKKSEENNFTNNDYEIVTEVPGDEEDMHQWAINMLGVIEDAMVEYGYQGTDQVIDALKKYSRREVK